MSKPNMPLDIAKEFLGASTREEDVDTGFTGAREVRWSRDERQVAYGMFSSVNNIAIATVIINDTKRFSETCFKEAEAQSLEQLGAGAVKDITFSELYALTPCQKCDDESLANDEQFCRVCGERNPAFNLEVFNLTFNRDHGEDRPGTYATDEEAAKACESPDMPWYHSVDKEWAENYNQENSDEPKIQHCSVCGKKL